MSSRQGAMLRLNVINRDNQKNKISIIVSARTPISKLKRKIEQEYNQLYGISVLVSVIEDSRGFVISNNSTIGQHVQSNESIYIETHKDKTGKNMNLTSDISDIFLTLRYVTGSVVQKIQKIEVNSSTIIDIIPQLLHLGFWYSNTEVVHKTCKFLNKIFSKQNIEQFVLQSKQIHNILLMKLFNFWFNDISNSFTLYHDICWELLQLLEKLSFNDKYAEILKNASVIKHIVLISKNQQVSNEDRKMALRIIKNVNGGKGSLIDRTKSNYIPSFLQTSNMLNQNDFQSIMDLLSSTNEDKLAALEFLSDEKSQLIAEATVRFDYYSKLMNVFLIRNIKTKPLIQKFNKTIELIILHTTKQKAVEIMQKDILKKIHNFLLQSPAQTHAPVVKFLELISKTSSSIGMFNIQVATQFIFSPYKRFQSILIQNLSIMSQHDKQVSKIRFIPTIKDIIRLSLKSQDNEIIRECLKIISNLSLDEQCRYQIINLKGIQVFIKYLQASKSGEIQRVSAKGLLNLSISSRQNKAKVLGSMNKILENFYRNDYDNITQGFIQTILKVPNI